MNYLLCMGVYKCAVESELVSITHVLNKTRPLLSSPAYCLRHPRQMCKQVLSQPPQISVSNSGLSAFEESGVLCSGLPGRQADYHIERRARSSQGKRNAYLARTGRSSESLFQTCVLPIDSCHNGTDNPKSLEFLRQFALKHRRV